MINIRSQCMNKNHKPNLSTKLIWVKFVLKRLLKIVNLQHYENFLVDYLNKLLEQKMISEISSEDYCSLLTGRELQGELRTALFSIVRHCKGLKCCSQQPLLLPSIGTNWTLPLISFFVQSLSSLLVGIRFVLMILDLF